MPTKTDKSDVPSVPPEGGVAIETVLRTLSKPRRRAILRQVCECGEPVDATAVATAVVAGEWAGRDEPVPAGERERVLRSLRHVHLPKLAAAGLIEYDRETETAVATEAGGRALSDLEQSLL
ncbi:hypothetical protein [Halalkalicoccus sp. NIPERK01]|uniref:DUF7344 domain-containing protein n=1 Tax=Halalkalicoccus sp. NIPERK01 TaxID=3053469 RepID=UPI00256EBC21|nr:hypothetical protein [Halalkalicoccus sp. NIPERK01]MDL5362400.1 hypothetical protein [Halalkalicoccus sp. NIPERK01]